MSEKVLTGMGEKVLTDTGNKVLADTGEKVLVDTGEKVLADTGDKVLADTGEKGLFVYSLNSVELVPFPLRRRKKTNKMNKFMSLQCYCLLNLIPSVLYFSHANSLMLPLMMTDGGF